MDSILLLLKHRENRHLLAEFLTKHYRVVVEEQFTTLPEIPADLILFDGPALDALWESIQRRKAAVSPLFLPCLLVTSRSDVGMATRHLWKSIDELILSPIEPVELHARVEILLRARRLSRELNRRLGDIEILLQAMSHELRAPLRAIRGFGNILLEDYEQNLDAEGRDYLQRLCRAGETISEMIDSLFGLLRLGHETVRSRSVELAGIIHQCLDELATEIRACEAEVSLTGPPLRVRGDPVLLRVALRNLISNALKYVAPGVSPRVRIHLSQQNERIRIEIQDNGIGIAPEHQQRVFEPFVRLHGTEEYVGFGLGLAIARKGVELMDGKLGVCSTPGQGSTFWIELPTE